MGRSVRERLQIIIALSTGAAFMMEQLDATIITTSAPQIAASLHQSPLRINLAITSYLLTLITFMPVSGWLADRFGARMVFCTSLGVFTLGSALCGLAANFHMLLSMRMLQGLGGGLMTPVGRLILLRAFPRSQLVTAMTYFNIPVVIGPTLGPALGGLITTYTSWHWIFFVNVPLGIAGILAAMRFAPNLKRTELHPFDGVGFFLIGCALALLQCAVQTLGLADIPWRLAVVFFLTSTAFLGCYFRRSRRIRHPILDLDLLAIRTFRAGMFVGGLSRIGINGVPYLLPLLLQLCFGKSPLETGLLVSVTCIGVLLVRPIASPLLRRMGFGRLLGINTAIAAICIIAFTALRAQTPDVWVLVVIIAFSLSRGLQFATINTLNYADIPRERLSQSTSLGGICQQISMGLGISISAAILEILSANDGTFALHSFQATFLILAALTLAASPGFFFLRRTDGAKAVPAGTV